MKPLLDLLILLLISFFVGVYNPMLGVFLLLMGLLLAAQYWKTVLLLGALNPEASRSRLIKAGILALILTGVLAVGLHGELNSEVTAVPDVLVSEAWNSALFPVLISIILLVALMIASLVTEKRKR